MTAVPDDGDLRDVTLPRHCQVTRVAGGSAHTQTVVVVPAPMKIMRTVALAGVAKKLYDESRKPENQARIRAAIARVKAKRENRR